MQTESPYFQPTPRAPKPFTPGVFPNDPTFEDCPADSNTCPMAWAARVLDSTDILVYSAGLYSWFSSYSQDCVARENCQARVVRVEQSSHIWLYGLATKATLEMVSPLNASATIAAKNQNGFLSSILAWLEGSERVIGRRFDGWPIFKQGSLRRAGLSPNCEAALYQTVKCDETVRRLMYSAYVGLVQNSTRLLLMCDSTCSESIRYMRGSIAEACRSTPDLAEGVPVLGFVDMLSSRWNETCFKGTTTGKYCNGQFTNQSMPQSFFRLYRGRTEQILTSSRNHGQLQTRGPNLGHAPGRAVLILQRETIQHDARFTVFGLR